MSQKPSAKKPGMAWDEAVWPDAVDGAKLLDEIVKHLERFLVLPEGAAYAMALWSVYTHAYDLFFNSPRLAFQSPVKRCGKTLALSLVGGLVARPLAAANVSAASVFRVIEKYRPTLLIDEADTFLRDNRELWGILNSGHTRSMAYVLRVVGDDYEPKQFSTWAPAAIALIKRLPPTLQDRSIVIPMQRPGPDEYIGDRVTPAALDDLAPLRAKAARWVRDSEAALRKADPEWADELNDREADNWRPLLAVAQVAGRSWPQQAELASKALSESDDELGEVSLQLLFDVRKIVGDAVNLPSSGRAGLITSAELATRLGSLGDRPWADWREGKPISSTQVASILRPFDVRPRVHRFPGGTMRAYICAELEDVCDRYLERRSD